MEKYNVYKSIQAQKEYCKNNGMPHFAPTNGICWNCRKNIYEERKVVHNKGSELESTHYAGVTVDSAGRSLVTGCPHCNRSYCD